MKVFETAKDVLNVPEQINSLDEFSASLARSLEIAAQNPEEVSAMAVALVGNPITVETVIDPQRWVDRQISGSQNAATRWEEGIQRPSRSFKEAALAAANKYKVRTMEAVNEGRWDKGMRNVDEDMAMRTALAVGGSGYASGVAARKDKITAKITKMHPMVVALKKNLDAMKSDTAADAEAKAIAAIRGMRAIGAALRA